MVAAGALHGLGDEGDERLAGLNLAIVTDSAEAAELGILKRSDECLQLTVTVDVSVAGVIELDVGRDKVVQSHMVDE